MTSPKHVWCLYQRGKRRHTYLVAVFSNLRKARSFAKALEKARGPTKSSDWLDISRTVVNPNTKDI